MGPSSNAEVNTRLEKALKSHDRLGLDIAEDPQKDLQHDSRGLRVRQTITGRTRRRWS